MESGVFPSIFKTALVSPIFKAGDKKDICNYRPISLLTILSKILEKVVNGKLVDYLETNKLLSEYQYGFRKSRSTEDAVLRLSTLVSDYLDAGQKVIGVFLDLKKAFDTISIPILLSKLEAMGVRGNVYNWFESYLKDRKQYTRIGSLLSDTAPCNYGIPQGSTIGPSLFLTYINNLPEKLPANADIIMFADDTVLLFHENSWDTVKTTTEQCLAGITEWLEDNLLTLNTEKTKYICFAKTKNGAPNKDFTITLHEFPCNRTRTSNSPCTCGSIASVSYIKYLGVLLDGSLTWGLHVENLCSRIRKMMYIFKNLRAVTDKKLILQIYKALCQSIIYYCITVWGGATKTIMLQLERAQRAVLKVSMGLPFRYPTTELYDMTELLSVRKLFILRVLSRYHSTVVPLLPKSTKRQHRCPIPYKKTSFAQRQYNFIAPRIYNKILIPRNTNTNIKTLSLHKFRELVHGWIKDMSYDILENLLSVPV